MKKLLARAFNSIDREIFLILSVILSLIVIIPVFTYIYYAKDLKSKITILNKNDTGIILLDHKNQPFFTFFQAKYKKQIPLSEIPVIMQKAVIASEDKDYYKHTGFSFKSIMRALHMNATSKKLYGGSTITQQLVKNVLLNPERSITRKIQEIILAQELERKYSKDEILEMYLNSIYFGEGVFGVENASKFYFAKSAKNLTLNESAFLTAILPSPSALSPFTGNKKELQTRKNMVLRKMHSQDYITESQLQKALASDLIFKRQNLGLNQKATHFALMVRDELIEKYGEEFIYRSGFRVKTTINLMWQKTAEEALAKQVNNLKFNNATNGSVVIIDPATGQLKVMVGSVSWDDPENGKINLATTPRSVGSSFKPIIYAAALEEGLITSFSTLHDTPTTFLGGYRPLNYDRSFRGPVTVRRALANSLNVPAVEVMQKLGVKKAIEMSNKFGINSLKNPDNYGLSLVLGSGEINLVEITGAYAVFANNGIRNEPVSILEITNKQGEKIFAHQPAPQKVINPDTAQTITSILSDNKARTEAFGDLLNLPKIAALKTGTSENWRDSLTIGYTPDLAIGVWIGNNDNTPMDGIAGSLGAAPVWISLINQLPQKYYNTTIVNLPPTP
jgi:1A family penicillin-binding protein